MNIVKSINKNFNTYMYHHDNVKGQSWKSYELLVIISNIFSTLNMLKEFLIICLF